MGKFTEGGNYYNKYESKNPVVKILMDTYFRDFESLIDPIKNEIENAFEIGCGEGYLTSHVKKMGINIEGADVSAKVIEHAKKMHPSITFSVCCIYELNNRSKKYDLLIASEVLEHLEEPALALKQLKDLTSKYIFLSVPNEPFFRLANVLRLKYLKDFGNTPGHINHWSKQGFKELIESRGLRIINIKTSTLWTMVICRIE
jgi:predicted TPR repeat methyltransferase